MNPSTKTNSAVKAIDLNFDNAIRKFAPKSKQCLPESFQPLEDSVIIGKGKMPAQATGNKRLRELVDVQLQNYANAKYKRDKTFIVTNILHTIQDLCPSGAFVKFDGERWWEVSDRISREKIACMFRDSLSGQYKSSNKNKVAKRRAQRAMKRTAALQQQRAEIQHQHHQGHVQQQKNHQIQMPLPVQSLEPQVSFNLTQPVSTPVFKPVNRKRDSILVLEGLDFMGGLLDIDRNVFDCADFFGDDDAARVSS
eukprot:CAMPEP_0113635032 /NCGR_PEP_ID=MMETSP0017_2-20120614/18251_1 /TAXON_ID=2856 /ORGANISM="Cylindrotheca closterium" /LENGTH=252 /DNA_ID=CAMNT_0000545775 /DNA_START=40 /DNA_END=794 /DNA_ORIENTATION=- /assembly_acc=CAM_ASM_000147